MPHAAFYVVELDEALREVKYLIVSMPHAAFYVVEHEDMLKMMAANPVSMPHAAFYVVEPTFCRSLMGISRCFNAARGFLCGGTDHYDWHADEFGFQCRTRLSMWWNCEEHLE